MRGRPSFAVISASPVTVGAVTVLVSIVAVFLAYNANNGLPFVPVYRVSVDIPNAARMTDNNEVRIGGVRVGVVESIDPVASRGGGSAETVIPTASAEELPPIAARVHLKLDKTAEPLPQDSIFRVRYRSAFGLKYLEIIRGTGPPAAEGHVFNGTDDGELCDLPSAGGRFVSSIPQQSRNGCFQGQTEFDEVNDTFDNRTRRAQRENFVGYGSGLAGRGVSLNESISQLPRLFGSLRPVARALSDREVNLSRFIRGLWRTARYTSPAAPEQAQFFDFAATAFTAISSDPESLKDAISEAPLTYETGIRLLPDQRVFLANVERFARLMRPGAQDLRITLPVFNEALETGAPVLRESPPVNRRLGEVLRELNQLVTQPSTRVTLERLNETFGTAKPLARWVVPAQTVCNLFGYWTTNFPGALSEPSQVGMSLRQGIVRFPGAPTAEVGMGGYTGLGPNGKTGTGEFRPYEIPLTNSHAYGPTGQRNADCQPGQIGYPLGQLLVPGQRLSDPANRVSDLPGSRGPLTSFWNGEGDRVLVDSRIDSRQPESWKGVGKGKGK
jgi:ABC-type transporter Mla subunit MlaD